MLGSKGSFSYKTISVSRYNMLFLVLFVIFYKGCNFHGDKLAEGQTVKWSDGCNYCTCNNGAVTCTNNACVGKYI